LKGGIIFKIKFLAQNYHNMDYTGKIFFWQHKFLKNYWKYFPLKKVLHYNKKGYYNLEIGYFFQIPQHF